MLSAHELIEPKSARTSQTSLGSAAIVRLRAMSATASSYPAGLRALPLFAETMRATSWPLRSTSIVCPAVTRSKHRPARVRSSSSPTHPASGTIRTSPADTIRATSLPRRTTSSVSPAATRPRYVHVPLRSWPRPITFGVALNWPAPRLSFSIARHRARVVQRAGCYGPLRGLTSRTSLARSSRSSWNFRWRPPPEARWTAGRRMRHHEHPGKGTAMKTVPTVRAG
jgi:hypothetical protein